MTLLQRLLFRPRHADADELTRLRALTLREFAGRHYLCRKAYSAAHRELTRLALDLLAEYAGRDPPVAECTAALFDPLSDWLADEVFTRRRFSANTANCRLRHLRAVVNAAWRTRRGGVPLVDRLPPLNFLAEPDSEITSFSDAQIADQVARASMLYGSVATAPAAAWWRAWLLVISSIGCRPNAMMLAARGDYDPARKALLLRAEHQKQRRAQRLGLPAAAAESVELLLAAHQAGLIWPWPHDRPREGRQQKWRCLTDHWLDRIIRPCGQECLLPKGVRLRMYRRTASSRCAERGGDPQRLLGHRSPRTTEEHYLDPARMPVCREALVG